MRIASSECAPFGLTSASDGSGALRSPSRRGRDTTPRPRGERRRSAFSSCERDVQAFGEGGARPLEEDEPEHADCAGCVDPCRIKDARTECFHPSAPFVVVVSGSSERAQKRNPTRSPLKSTASVCSRGVWKTPHTSSHERSSQRR